MEFDFDFVVAAGLFGHMRHAETVVVCLRRLPAPGGRGMSERDEDPRLHDYAGWTCPECAKGEHEDCLGIRRMGKLRNLELRDEVCVCPCPYPDDEPDE